MPQKEKDRRMLLKQTPKIIESLRIEKEKKEECKEIQKNKFDFSKKDPDALYRERFKGQTEEIINYKNELNKLKNRFAHNIYNRTANKKEKRFEYLVHKVLNQIISAGAAEMVHKHDLELKGSEDFKNHKELRKDQTRFAELVHHLTNARTEKY